MVCGVPQPDTDCTRTQGRAKSSGVRFPWLSGEKRVSARQDFYTRDAAFGMSAWLRGSRPVRSARPGKAFHHRRRRGVQKFDEPAPDLQEHAARRLSVAEPGRQTARRGVPHGQARVPRTQHRELLIERRGRSLPASGTRSKWGKIAPADVISRRGLQRGARDEYTC
jgi:hypothetical protein